MAAPIRVLSIPAGHVYVQHLAHPDVPGVRRIDDPPVNSTAPAAQWWPPRALDARWLRRHAGEFELVHLHFGFDGQSPAQLREMAGTLAELGKPFVYTVHDLRNPHHDTHTLHDEQLDVLVPAADRLITLTPGAAEEIKDRWGRVTPSSSPIRTSWTSRPSRHRGTPVTSSSWASTSRACVPPWTRAWSVRSVKWLRIFLEPAFK